MNDNRPMRAGVLTLVSALIVITPLCGYLFVCGCTWPWSGWADHCNYYDPRATDKCPWCRSTMAGVFSVGSSLGAACMAAMHSYLPGKIRPESFSALLIRSAAGIAILVMVAAVGARLSAMAQGYPHFVSFMQESRL